MRLFIILPRLINVRRVREEMPAGEKDTYQNLVNLIVENQNRFYLFAYSYVKNKETSLDMVQEAVYKALKSSDQLKNTNQMKAWFYRILANVCLDEIRKSKHSIATDPEVFIEQDLRINDKQEDVSQAELLDLYKALNELEPKTKAIIILRYFEDMKLADIAKILGINLSTVKSTLYRALDSLKIQLKGDVFQNESMG